MDNSRTLTAAPAILRAAAARRVRWSAHQHIGGAVVDGAPFQLHGNPDEIRDAAVAWTRFAQCCRDAAGDVSRTEVSGFRGDEADLHAERMRGEFVPALAATAAAWSAVAVALTGYARQLEDCQQRLRQLAARAQDQPAAAPDVATALAAALAVQQEHTAAAARCAGDIDRAAAGRPAPSHATGRLGPSVRVDVARYGHPDPLAAVVGAARVAAAAAAGLASRLPAAAPALPLLTGSMLVGSATGVRPAASRRTVATAVPTARKNAPLRSAGPPPWIDNADRHNAARDAALEEIKREVAAKGGNAAMVQRETKILGASKNGSGQPGFADITYLDQRSGTQYVWEVKGSTDPVSAFRQGLAAVAEVQWYVAASTRTAEFAHVAPGFALTAPVATTFTGKDGAVELLTVSEGPGPGAIVYVASRQPKGPVPQPPPLPVPVPVPVPQPQHDPQPVPAAPSINPAPVLGGVAAGGMLWWLGKILSPACGPALFACAVVL